VFNSDQGALKEAKLSEMVRLEAESGERNVYSGQKRIILFLAADWFQLVMLQQAEQRYYCIRPPIRDCIIVSFFSD
jgi:hypothetical protein